MIKILTQDIDYQISNEKVVKYWLNNVALEEGAIISKINYVLCSDSYLYSINMQFLNHDTLTDIITFPYNEQKQSLEADIYISIDRVEDNAKEISLNFTAEFHRVLVHGLLHLCGYDDHEENTKKEMRSKEDYYLSLRPEILV